MTPPPTRFTALCSRHCLIVSCSSSSLLQSLQKILRPSAAQSATLHSTAGNKRSRFARYALAISSAICLPDSRLSAGSFATWVLPSSSTTPATHPVLVYSTVSSTCRSPASALAARRSPNLGFAKSTPFPGRDFPRHHCNIRLDSLLDFQNGGHLAPESSDIFHLTHPFPHATLEGREAIPICSEFLAGNAWWEDSR